MGQRSRFQNLEIAEDSESDAEDYLPLSTTKQVVKPTSGGANVKKMDKEHLVGDRTKFNPKPSQFIQAIMRRQRSIRWHVKKRSEITGGEKIMKESYHKRRSARQNKFQQPGEKAGSETTTCFLFKPRFG